jgi:hypothetical protein
MRITQTILERMENNMLKWCGHVVRMEDNRWSRRIMAWSAEGRRRPEIKWVKEIERVTKQRTLTFDDAINQQQWRLKKATCGSQHN